LSLGSLTFSCVCPVGVPGMVYLKLQFDDKVSEAVTQLLFVKQPQIVSAIPSVVSPAGSESILILGNHFLFDTEVFCIFGNLQTVGKFVSSNQLYCLTPVLSVMSVEMRVGFSGMMSDSLPLVVSFNLEAIKIHPSIGFSSGGGVITVLGDLFKSSSNSFCKFGSSVAPASFVNTSCVTCILPPSNSVGVVQFRVLLDFALNTSKYTSFLYIDQPVISTMKPTFGSKSGGTLVTIHITNVTPGRSLLCRFGSMSRVASYIENGHF
jgi:hypothetical protein